MAWHWHGNVAVHAIKRDMSQHHHITHVIKARPDRSRFLYVICLKQVPPAALPDAAGEAPAAQGRGAATGIITIIIIIIITIITTVIMIIIIIIIIIVVVIVICIMISYYCYVYY